VGAVGKEHQMPRNKVLTIIDEFITKAKNAPDDKTGRNAINYATSNGVTIEQLSNAIAASSIQGQDLTRPLGQEAARVPNTPENQNWTPPRTVTLRSERTGI
jgi:hypothetical protein